MTRFAMDALFEAAKAAVTTDGLRPVSRELDIPLGVLRAVLERKDVSVANAERAARALNLEFYIGPPRETGQVEQIVLDGADYVQIPVHDAAFAAGCGVENPTERIVDHLAFGRTWLIRMGITASTAVLVAAAGDSMAPTIHDGDLLLIDRARASPPQILRSPKDTRPAPIYAILDEGMARVKRIELMPGATLALLSDNVTYRPEFRPISAVSIIGRVMWWGHTNRE